MKINIFKTTTIIDRENASKYIHSDEAELPLKYYSHSRKSILWMLRFEKCQSFRM